jgi:hypothetical protein
VTCKNRVIPHCIRKLLIHFIIYIKYSIEHSIDRLCGLDPEARVRLPALPDFLGGGTVVGVERGPFSLVSTTEKLLDRKVAAPV